ncbi:hypothetical protein F5Y17DRAFT_210289 [Xylariaceae sp. FL0594]|nr:hypothetical protein F5Y17DRAFT_210289 [Xylariaceae sp. FL0594]
MVMARSLFVVLAVVVFSDALNLLLVLGVQVSWDLFIPSSHSFLCRLTLKSLEVTRHHYVCNLIHHDCNLNASDRRWAQLGLWSGPKSYEPLLRKVQKRPLYSHHGHWGIGIADVVRLPYLCILT